MNLVTLLLSLAIFDVVYAQYVDANVTMIEDFGQITPTSDLSWISCFQNYTCAVLQVPLDYTEPKVGNTTVAFIKLPSPDSTAQDLLINPGGPGESGIDFVRNEAQLLTKVFGSEYNIVGFDPRGVGHSGISLDCFPESNITKRDYGLDILTRPIGTDSDTSLYASWVLARGTGQRCALKQDVAQPKRYANTVAVAHDLQHYTELRAKLLGLPANEAKLWFNGGSYGTVLGQTFATLFPEQVGRMILDGVVDTDLYFAEPQLDDYKDAAAALDSYFQYCFAAGPELCPFFGNATSIVDLRARFDAIYNDLKQRPILLDTSKTFIPLLFDVGDFKALLLDSLYTLFDSYPGFSDVFIAIEQRDSSFLTEVTPRIEVGSPTVINDLQASYSLMQISCIDNAGRTNVSAFEDFNQYVRVRTNASSFFGDDWTSKLGPFCAGLNLSPPSSQIFAGKIGSINTASPILFASTLVDPVTPLTNAKFYSSRFPGAGLLSVNGTGHGALSVPSTCYAERVRSYLEDATLPPAGSLCQPDAVPFSPPGNLNPK